MTRHRRLAGAGIAVVVALSAMAGCHAARVVAPPPPLRAASASDFAVDVEFAESLDRASAEDVTHYTVRALSGPGTPETIFSATVVDSLYGRVVQLLISSGPLVDGADYAVDTHDIRTIDAGSTGARSITFRTGLSYAAPLRDLFDSRCATCHGNTQAEGNYRTDSYAALFGNGVDATPNLIAGNPNCLLLRKCRPGRSMWDAGVLTYFDFEMLLNWTVSYGARP